ncbi:MAG: aldo/keto reductase [Cyanophyceae cyanobacterium]
MDYRRFGRTGLSISAFSLGTMRCLSSPDRMFSTLEKAIAVGINHVETARSYGNSESYLGQAFQGGIKREDLHLTTKLLPKGNAKDIDQWIDESLERLNTNYLDMLAIHGVNTWEHLEWVLDDSAAAGMAGIDQAIADGRINHLGFSSHGSLELLLEVINSDRFEFVNLHYGYFLQRNEPAIALADEKDMGVFIISPADKGGQLYAPPPKLMELCHPLTPLEWGYRFLLADPRITTLSVGSSKPSELAMVANIDDGKSLNFQERKVLDALDQEALKISPSEQYVQYYDCLPCPEDVAIPEILRLKNLADTYGMEDYAKYRYGMLENAGHWFPGRRGDRCNSCGNCVSKFPEKADIPSMLRDAHSRFGETFGRRLWDD